MWGGLEMLRQRRCTGHGRRCLQHALLRRMCCAVRCRCVRRAAPTSASQTGSIPNRAAVPAERRLACAAGRMLVATVVQHKLVHGSQTCTRVHTAVLGHRARFYTTYIICSINLQAVIPEIIYTFVIMPQHGRTGAAAVASSAARAHARHGDTAQQQSSDTCTLPCIGATL